MMRKFFIISFALLIILSGMQITVATHFCGGKIAAIKVSFSGAKASCGMESDGKTNSSSEANIASHCCNNIFAVYSVDNNYAPSAFHFKEITQSILHEFYFSEGFSFHSNFSPLTNLTNVSPPDNYMANAVSIADICVFRI